MLFCLENIFATDVLVVYFHRLSTSQFLSSAFTTRLKMLTPYVHHWPQVCVVENIFPDIGIFSNCK